MVVLHGTAAPTICHGPYNRLVRLLSFCAVRNWRTAPCHLPRHRAQCLGQRAGPTCWATSSNSPKDIEIGPTFHAAQEDISIFKRSASAVARQIYVHGTLMTLLFAISEEAQSVTTCQNICLHHWVQFLQDLVLFMPFRESQHFPFYL